MSKVVKVLTMMLVVTALVITTEWLFGPEAAGTALLMTGIFIGGYVGTGWGGRQATKTHEYREELLYGKKADEAPKEPGPEKDPKNPDE